MKTPAAIADMADTLRDACLENADGRAPARRTLLATGWISTLIAAITTGAFFNALMLAIGADDVIIGYVSMITTLCGILQIFAPLLWERVPRRKPFLVIAGFFSNIMTYGVITLIPFLPIESSGKIGLYVAVTVVTGALNAVTSPASNAWTTQSIPLAKRVNYTSVSTLVSTVINIISAFLAGLCLDGFEATEASFMGLTPTLSAIVLIRALAFVLVMLSSVLSAVFVKEYPYEDREEGKKRNELALLFLPLRNKAFLLAISIPCIWSFIGAIIGNFFMLHLVENVHMSYTLINSAQIISTPLVLLLTPVWTAILKKHSWVSTLSVALFGYSIAYLCNVFISEQTQYFYFICIVVGHLFNPCITMVNGNLLYLKLPEENQTAFFGFYAIATMACSFLGQTVGTLFVKWTPDLRLSWFGVPVCNLQLTSFIASVLAMCLALFAYRFSKILDEK